MRFCRTFKNSNDPKTLFTSNCASMTESSFLHLCDILHLTADCSTMVLVYNPTSDILLKTFTVQEMDNYYL